MRCLALLVLVLALPAAADTPERYLDETQDLTRAAPSSSSDGVSLIGASGYAVRGFMVALCTADTGQTLNGSGYLRAWVWHGRKARWMRNPDLDLRVTATVACQAWPDLRPGYLRSRRTLFTADTVTVTGTAVDPLLEDKLIVSIDGDTGL
jgi:hypothetical protein